MFSGLTSYLFGSSTTEETSEDQQQTVESTSTTTTSPSPSRKRTKSPSCGLKTVAAEDEDEWMLVDKSSRGNSPFRLVGTNPMENLLIEHTSMSVYGPRGRPSSRGHESDESEGSVNEATEGPSCKKSRAVTAQPPRRPKAVAMRAGLEAQVQSLKSMQKSKQKKESRHLNRSQLSKSNKVQHLSGRQQQRRKQHYTLRPSGRCNDRKSQ